MSDALRFEQVEKRYGRHVALAGLSFRVPKGSLCGFVGPNGAGKTTAFSLVCGFLRADAGAVHVLGDVFDPWRLKGRIGALPQDADLGDRHTPRELLVHLAKLQGVDGAVREAERVLDVVNLGAERDRRIATLSHGMRRRVAVASALVGAPELVLLDEPTAGLDPVQARSLRAALATRPKGQTLVISSHNLDELERLCDHVVMVDRGRCVGEGALAEVTGRGRLVEWVLGPGEVALESLCAAVPSSTFRVDGALLVQRAGSDAELDASSVEVMRALVAQGVGVREVRRGVSLERSFLEKSGG